MEFSPEIIESLCEYADSRRAAGIPWESILGELLWRDRRGELAGLTVRTMQGWHGKWQKGQYARLKAQERREVSLEALTEEDQGRRGDAMEARMQGYGEAYRMQDPEAQEEEVDEGREGRGFSDEVRELVKYLGADLVEKGEPRWQYARHRVLKEGQYFEKREGPGALAGQRWLKGAVLIWLGTVEGAPALVEVFPEHRIKRVIPPQPPWVCNLTLRLEVFSLVNVGHVKSMEELLLVEVQLKEKGLGEKPRAALERKKRRLECKLAFAGEDSAVTVLRVQLIVSKLATVMDLHCPELTGAGSGAALGAATGRTRAAQSAARLKIVEEMAARTGGRAGYAGLRAGGKYAERGREAGGL